MWNISLYSYFLYNQTYIVYLTSLLFEDEFILADAKDITIIVAINEPLHINEGEVIDNGLKTVTRAVSRTLAESMTKLCCL